MEILGYEEVIVPKKISNNFETIDWTARPQRAGCQDGSVLNTLFVRFPALKRMLITWQTWMLAAAIGVCTAVAACFISFTQNALWSFRYGMCYLSTGELTDAADEIHFWFQKSIINIFTFEYASFDIMY